MNADEARKRGLGAARGIGIGVIGGFLFWLVIAAIVIVLLSSCSEHDADNGGGNYSPPATIEQPEPVAPPVTVGSHAQELRSLLDEVGYGYLDDNDTDATLDEAGRVTCTIFRSMSFGAASETTIQAAIDTGLTYDESVSLIAAIVVTYCPDVDSTSGLDY